MPEQFRPGRDGTNATCTERSAMTFRHLALAALCSAGLAASAAANDRYVTAHGSFGPFLETHSFVAPNSNAGGQLTGDVRYNNAYTLGASAGVFFTPSVRAGVELNYYSLDTRNMFVEFPAPPPAVVSLSGRISGITAFADAAYEHRFSDRFSGFVEAGAGIMHLSANNVTTGPNFNGFLNDNDTVLAAKIGIGGVFRLNDRVDLFGEYNYVFGQNANMNFTAPGAGIPSVPFRIETSAHVVQMGVRLKF
jgi:hypothetical protein